MREEVREQPVMGNAEGTDQDRIFKESDETSPLITRTSRGFYTRSGAAEQTALSQQADVDEK